ncbi:MULTISPECIES: aminoglycoside phosphotransferase family protein [Actinosynnema]|uniref:phosphotransferase family protein n=1 Tax=Actinosynnema TaxID=40566 RepID=UPI0020A40B76|nr:aminoglycoside phosphotransferase family protein [Actinosynnema pretiosum]MCP2097742.1 putative kinase, aminoglycoside phosphotransferase (APT) family [Actinosynnema pretiosum]
MSAGSTRLADAVTAEEVEAVLAELCPTAVVSSVRAGPHSYSNRLWLAGTDEGELLVRVPGRTTDPEYVGATLVATDLAADAGIPVVRFRAFSSSTGLGLPVVVQEYRPGESATAALRGERSDLARVAGVLGGWVGALHGVRRAGFGPVTSAGDARSWAEVADGQVRGALSRLPGEMLPAGRAPVEAAFGRVLDELGSAGEPSLAHGDLYLDNVLVDGGRPTALLDFEHAGFRDRFADFGKLTELLFEWWPGSEEPFLEAYRERFPAEASDAVRRRLGTGLYALAQLEYFARWQPDLVQFYRDRLGEWVAGR